MLHVALTFDCDLQEELLVAEALRHSCAEVLDVMSICSLEASGG
jgi:hypothetical protein